MKKLIFTSFFCSVLSSLVFAQVGIGTNTPNTSSVLELSSTTKAFIPPRMTSAQRDLIVNPTAGMMIFNTTATCVEIFRGTQWYNICTGTSSTPPTPSSNTVAAANLIAHWTFDNTKAEAISGVLPTTGGTVTNNASGGQIGGYASFNNGYLVYPTITNINKPDALAAGFTFTTWAKVPTATNLTSLWQINGNINDIWGLVAYTFRHFANDSLDLDGTISHVNGSGVHSTYGDAFREGTAADFKTAPTAWAFLAMVYDTTGGTKQIKYYCNGVYKGAKTISTAVIPANEQFELIATSSFGGTGRQQVTFGTFNYSGSPAVFPSGGTSSSAWQNTSLPSGAAIDDTRLFNKALSQTEISDLWTRGSAGN
ncbi:hypothetical protein ACQ33O_10485 [Ferruginibacter sp. SUN002]|uniref:hypothetical protein n=1 Tax=Ferruginibacter sp. SUN002 TaxID=2937789 RepID=UPI003D360339